MIDPRFAALSDGYRHAEVITDPASQGGRFADYLGDGSCVVLHAMPRERHPRGLIEVFVPIPMSVLNDPAYDVVAEVRPLLDEAVAHTIAVAG